MKPQHPTPIDRLEPSRREFMQASAAGLATPPWHGPRPRRPRSRTPKAFRMRPLGEPARWSP